MMEVFSPLLQAVAVVGEDRGGDVIITTVEEVEMVVAADTTISTTIGNRIKATTITSISVATSIKTMQSNLRIVFNCPLPAMIATLDKHDIAVSTFDFEIRLWDN